MSEGTAVERNERFNGQNTVIMAMTTISMNQLLRGKKNYEFRKNPLKMNFKKFRIRCLLWILVPGGCLHVFKLDLSNWPYF
jgi:hypothetical protein